MFQPLARAEKAADVYDQPAVLRLENGQWLGVFRANLAEYQVEYKGHYGRVLRQPPLWQVVSGDGGKSWTPPAHLCSAHYPYLLRLPDGALMLTNMSGSRLRYQISYNEGTSWSFEDSVLTHPHYNFYPGRTFMSDLSVLVLDDRTLLGTYFCDDAPGGGPRLAATWIRALPAGSPEARERGL